MILILQKIQVDLKGQVYMDTNTNKYKPLALLYYIAMKKIFFVLFTALLLTGCEDDDALVASGNTVTETRNVGDFWRLDINAGKVVKIIYADDAGIIISGSENLLQHLRTKVSNGKLTLDYDQDQINYEDVEVTIKLPFFRELIMNGRRNLTTHGTFEPTDHIIITSHGENEMTAMDHFETETVDINLTGNGKVDFRALSSENAKASITGDGKIYIKAAQTLKAQILGNGAIYFLGDPQVTSDIKGNGSVSAL